MVAAPRRPDETTAEVGFDLARLLGVRTRERARVRRFELRRAVFRLRFLPRPMGPGVAGTGVGPDESGTRSHRLSGMVSLTGSS